MMMKCKYHLGSIKAIVLVSCLLLSVSINAQIDKESNFYTPPTSYANTKNLVDDYGVDNNFDTDDSESLQEAIDFVSTNGGGKIYIPEGNYTFTEINLKSNVHLEIESSAIIKPAPRTGTRGYRIFYLSSTTATPIENVSIVGINGKFTVDITEIENKSIRVVNLQNVHNFLLDNIKIEEAYSKFAAVVFNGIEVNDYVYGPQHGIMKNIENYGAIYGYGVMQMQLGKNLLFKNIYGEGGATLRFEPHVKNLRDIGTYEVIDDIVGRNITCKNGCAALMLSPHFITNGKVDMRGIHGIGTGITVRLENGFTTKEEADLGLTAGSFSSESIIRDVTATFTNSKAQLKPKHYKYMPCELRSLISTEPIVENGASYTGPAIAAVVYSANYTVDFSEEDVTITGAFPAGQEVVYPEDAMSDQECENTSNNAVIDHMSYLDIYPNPATNKLRIDGLLGKEKSIKLFNLLGHCMLSKALPLDNTQTMELDVADLERGLYVLAMGDLQYYKVMLK